jgi:hypothetical protein
MAALTVGISVKKKIKKFVSTKIISAELLHDDRRLFSSPYQDRINKTDVPSKSPRAGENESQEKQAACMDDTARCIISSSQKNAGDGFSVFACSESSVCFDEAKTEQARRRKLRN